MNIQLKLPERGGTTLFIQRAPKTEGEFDSNEIALAQDHAQKLLRSLLQGTNDKIREEIRILIVANDSRLGVRNIPQPDTTPSIEVARVVLQAATSILAEFNMSEAQLLNITASAEGGVVEISEIKSEDPDNTTDRMKNFLSFARLSKNYHGTNPGQRLILWTITHGADMRPYLERIISEPLEKDVGAFAPFEGMQIVIDSQGSAVANVAGNNYKTNLDFSSMVVW